LRDAINRALERARVDRPKSLVATKKHRRRPVSAIERVERQFNILDNLDLSQRVRDKHFKTKLAEQQSRLNLLQREARRQGVSTIVVFEGWDASGKGGAIRRVTAALDARDYDVIPIAGPTDEERARHYLWGFWLHLSRAGRMTISRRSWYGRVLVERVEGLAKEAEYMRAYGEITHFEEQLVTHGILIVNFWVPITKDEEPTRF